LVGPIRVTRGVSGRGGLWCLARLSFQLDILRLMTRGLERNRRGAKSRSRISCRAVTSARASREGGKCRLVGDVAADDAQGAGEGNPVRVLLGLMCGLVH